MAEGWLVDPDPKKDRGPESRKSALTLDLLLHCTEFILGIGGLERTEVDSESARFMTSPSLCVPAVGPHGMKGRFDAGISG